MTIILKKIKIKKKQIYNLIYKITYSNNIDTFNRYKYENKNIIMESDKDVMKRFLKNKKYYSSFSNIYGNKNMKNIYEGNLKKDEN